MKLDRKVAFVTGAAGGLGSGVVRACLAKDMKVALADFDPTRLEAVREALGRAADDAIAFMLDVSDYDAWQVAVDSAEAALGPIFLLANVVGIGSNSPLAQEDPARMRAVMEVNACGHWYGCRTMVPRMISRGEAAHIINVASISGLVSHPSSSVYNASKYAVIGMSNALRYELSGSNVGLSVAYPGLMNTNFAGNSLSYMAGAKVENDIAESPYEAMMKSGMDSDAAAQMIVEAAIRGDYWIMTHPHWKHVITQIDAERNAAIGGPAQPGYTDGLPADLAQRHRDVMAGKPAQI